MDSKYNLDINSLNYEETIINIIEKPDVDTLPRRCKVCNTAFCFLYKEEDGSSTRPSVCSCNVQFCTGYKGKFFRYNSLLFLDSDEYDRYLQELEDTVDFYRTFRD